ncbi:MAG TPA: SH3 domain-containing protein [Pirellulales bacterium]|jgi:SH3-like domain-containing protein|nr:SH3 domain-containing protein [Pirellulales bacterium]
MRILGVVVGSCCAGLVAGLAPAAEDGQFPYTAYANSDDVYVRSGPGKNYYPTEKLSRGDAVEIYRHDPGGWYAIRPPRGSFSWVPAQLLQPTRDHLAVTNGDRVVSRVGSRFSDVRDVIQVRLDRGEEVEILEVKTLVTGGQSEQWCKIAPPSGEFRWVFGKFVDEQQPMPERRPAEDRSRSVADRDPSGEDRPVRAVSAVRSGRYYTEDTDPPDAGDDDGGNVLRTSGARGDNPGGGERDVALTAASDRASDWRRNGPTRSAAKPAAAPPADAFQAEIDAIDLALSSMVVEEPSVWKFDDLDRRAETALDRAQTALERGKARLLLDRIAKFEDIKRRADTIQQVQAATDRRNSQTINVADTRPPIGLAQVEGNDRFDASGRLINVVSQRPNAPPYALVNADRVVMAFVTPAPGVNLRPFINRQIGVSGQRGFIPELNKPHITALRVSTLDESPSALAASRDPLRR